MIEMFVFLQLAVEMQSPLKYFLTVHRYQNIHIKIMPIYSCKDINGLMSTTILTGREYLTTYACCLAPAPDKENQVKMQRSSGLGILPL
jgi:hypothetical protein